MTRTVRFIVARLGAAMLVPLAVDAQGPEATISGRVIVRTTDIPLGFAVVSIGTSGTEKFTDGSGRFTFRNVRPGRISLSARHVGYAPFDTTLDVSAGDSVRLDLGLSLVTIQLPAIHSLAQECVHPGAVGRRVSLELAALLDQVKQNAERNRLLSRSYPFELTVERRIARPEPSLEARFVAYDTVRRSSERPWRYQPGKMLGSREVDGGVFGGKWVTLTVPELADFADERFLINHCFDYGGLEVVDGDTLLRVEFVPAPAIHDPDVAGAIFLDPKTYQLRSTIISLANLTKQLREQIAGQDVRATFTEVIPGVPVMAAVSSSVYPKYDEKYPATEPSTERQRILSVRFLKTDPRR